jgi:hypothetical protein
LYGVAGYRGAQMYVIAARRSVTHHGEIDIRWSDIL